MKAMSERRGRVSLARAAMLAGVAAGAPVVACDAPLPTEPREGVEEVMGDEGADTQAYRTERFPGWRFLGYDLTRPYYLAPLVFVDGVRIRLFDDVPESLRVRYGDGLEPGAIERIEVLKGRMVYGDEAALGLILIFTKDADPGLEVIERVATLKGPARYGGEAAGWVFEIFTKDADRGLEVTAAPEQAMEPVTEVIETPAVTQFVVTRQARATDRAADWDKWISENVSAKVPPGWKPVVHVDGVRVDSGTTGLNNLLPTLDPGRIDRIVAGNGEVATKFWGGEVANGVILIYTEQKS